MTYTTFRVGVSDSQDCSVFLPITVFGKQSEAVAKYVTKGHQVLVEGRIAENLGGRFNVVADRVVFGASPEKAEKKQPTVKSK